SRLDYAMRAVHHRNTGVPNRSDTQTVCLLATVDSSGNPTDGRKHYKVLLPAEVPVNDSWEVVAYSMVTRSFINTPANRVAVSSTNPIFKTNPAGSIAIDLVPNAPAGRA